MSENGNEIVPFTATVAEAASHCGVKPSTVRRWLRRKDPPPHRKYGHEYRFNLALLDAWGDERAQEARLKEAV